MLSNVLRRARPAEPTLRTRVALLLGGHFEVDESKDGTPWSVAAKRLAADRPRRRRIPPRRGIVQSCLAATVRHAVWLATDGRRKLSTAGRSKLREHTVRAGNSQGPVADGERDAL